MLIDNFSTILLGAFFLLAFLLGYSVNALLTSVKLLNAAQSDVLWSELREDMLGRIK